MVYLHGVLHYFKCHDRTGCAVNKESCPIMSDMDISGVFSTVIVTQFCSWLRQAA